MHTVGIQSGYFSGKTDTHVPLLILGDIPPAISTSLN